MKQITKVLRIINNNYTNYFKLQYSQLEYKNL